MHLQEDTEQDTECRCGLFLRYLRLPDAYAGCSAHSLSTEGGIGKRCIDEFESMDHGRLDSGAATAVPGRVVAGPQRQRSPRAE
jgi:hypothetical protein